MSNDAIVDIRAPRLLDLATYVSLIVMMALGLAGQRDTAARVAVVGLCVACGLVHAFGFRATRTEWEWRGYFALQTLLIGGMLALRSGTSDVFTFLFFVLSMQVMLVRVGREAILWIALFFLVSSAGALWSRGADGLISIIFNIAVFFLCGVFGGVLRQTEIARRRNQQLVEELRLAQRQLQDLAVAEERNRLARDLHDSAKQQVFATIMQIGAARVLIDRDPRSARERMVEAERLAQQAGAELTLLIHELRPVALDGKDLSEALRDYAADWSRQCGIAAETRAEGAYPLPAATEHALLRVTQEALANVARHSQAGAVTIDLRYDAGSLALTIADDGRGFDLGAAAKGVGLASMRERVEALGGSLCVESRAGTGTRVILTVPDVPGGVTR